MDCLIDSIKLQANSGFLPRCAFGLLVFVSRIWSSKLWCSSTYANVGCQPVQNSLSARSLDIFPGISVARRYSRVARFHSLGRPSGTAWEIGVSSVVSRKGLCIPLNSTLGGNFDICVPVMPLRPAPLGEPKYLNMRSQPVRLLRGRATTQIAYT